ncbi:MAG TPA: FAD-binding oxidoreductase [Gemmatimonadota bacterium]|nr:FAD-binding oxidoreductase [Gemmatimonadota bacterium]
MSRPPITGDALASFPEHFTGIVVTPQSPEYHETRRVHNGFIDRRPAVIARCVRTADVVYALGYARERGLEVAVRGGGHNVAGRAVCDDGLVIDLSLMKGMSVDAGARTARAEPGLTWAEFNATAFEHRLATTGGVVSTTGIAGLTLGGGLGHLMPRFGMTVDNLVSAEVVLADGRVVTASEEEDADLFWAIRGGGGNFGIVTSFEYRLHPVDVVTAGIVAHAFDDARDVLRFYRDLTSDLPDEVMAFGGLVHAPDGSGAKLAALVLCDSRPPGTDDAVVERAKAFGSPVLDVLGPMPYPACNELLDAGYPRGAHNYWKSSFLADLSDDAIDGMIEAFAQAPSPMDALLLEHFHGAATRVPVPATAYPHREVGYNFAVLSEWMDPALADPCVAWARETYDAMEPHFADAAYVNYLADDTSAADVASAYGPNLPRLRELKTRYDQDNVFHLNQNIRPA